MICLVINFFVITKPYHDRDDLKDGDEESGTDDRLGRVPSPETLPDHDLSAGCSPEAERLVSRA